MTALTMARAHLILELTQRYSGEQDSEVAVSVVDERGEFETTPAMASSPWRSSPDQ
ncbi:hypothetical protein [Rhodococcus sp. ABRD24]|uniref:hypothetical protein n=1 Tax=Rhodococcus sp. ABRD24 TaxID=2507582 RepID=UPI0013F169FE|nr:hypothetical protein [Rhodococcus sp. ABRD24]